MKLSELVQNLFFYHLNGIANLMILPATAARLNPGVFLALPVCMRMAKSLFKSHCRRCGRHTGGRRAKLSL